MEFLRARRTIFAISVPERVTVAVTTTDPATATRAVGTATAASLAAWATMFALHGAPASHASLALVWMVMTVGMMAPSAIPMIATFWKVSRQLDGSRSAPILSGVFLFAYVFVWMGYGLVAAILQTEMRRGCVVDEHLAFANPTLAAGLLAAAALYQFSPLKNVCLAKCRSPLGFLIGAYQPGYGGAFLTGAWHGIFCLGCCWLLMALAWVGGVLSMLWMVFVSALVILERTLPAAASLEKAVGFLLLGVALVLMSTKGQEGMGLYEAVHSLCLRHS